MIIPAAAVVQFFKYKVVSSIIVLTCNWNASDQVKFARHLSQHGMGATFSCDPNTLADAEKYRFEGVLYVKHLDEELLGKVKPEYFSLSYKWLVIGDDLPNPLHKARYDADMALLQLDTDAKGLAFSTSLSNKTVYFSDIYVHPRDGASTHPWAFWTEATRFKPTHDWERILRRNDLKKYPLRIAAPIGLYTNDWYDGTFKEYLLDESIPERDSSVRSGYITASLLLETVNASEVLVSTKLWNSLTDNDSMFYQVSTDGAQLSGAILRILIERVTWLDFVIDIWPFRVGFMYLAERESSSNMFIEPFSAGVWWSCLGVGVILAVALKVTARKPEEKEGAYVAVLATILQQDASAVPEGLSGRWTFLILSMASMLVHAYYTSAIVSDLMSGGNSGPDSLRALGDSRYAIASEHYGYMKYLFWEVNSKWDDMEYLKKKKMTSKFYQNLERGVELIQEGNTAFHTEYNQLYPHLKTFSDDQLCKLQHIDTIPEVLTWVTAAKNGQWTALLRSRGAWLHETGLAKRLVSKLKIKPPPCRSSMLAERVKFGDVTPLMALTAVGAVMSCVVLGLELLVDRLKRGERPRSAGGEDSVGLGSEYAE